MSRVNKLVEIAYAMKPLYQDFRSFHVAAIFNKNKLISLAHNTRKTHPFALKYGYPWANHAIHAECLAIIRGKLEDYSGHDLIVLRIDNNNQLNLSCPCSFCEKLTKIMNFDNVFFSDRNGRFVRKIG